ncbi:MAG: hypothetical protein WD941_00250 [Opitutus sp.]
MLLSPLIRGGASLPLLSLLAAIAPIEAGNLLAHLLAAILPTLLPTLGTLSARIPARSIIGEFPPGGIRTIRIIV